MNTRLTVILVLSALVLLFVIQNIASTEIQFLFWSFQMSRSLLLLFILLIGVVIGWFLNSYFRHQKNNRQ